MEIYLWPTIGGILIGASALLLMLSVGKIAGISGITWAMLSKETDNNDRLWRWLFILGLPLGTLMTHSLIGKPLPMVSETPIQAALAGLLVGVGVKVGSGCTSGHGVCGISRFSTRSIVATITFMTTAIVTVALTR